jgi:prepilin-type N-terminal cleavage/methylation domain-containing protein
MRTRTFQLRARAGFTLVELIISMAVSSLLIAAFFGTIATMQRQYRTQRDSRMAEDGLRTAEQMLRTVLQAAGADPLSTGLSSLDPGSLVGGKFTTIAVKSDFNPADGDVSDPLEDIAVKVLADTLLVRWTGTGTWQALAYPVRSLTFEYFDRNLTALTTTATAANAIAVRFTISAPDNPKSTILRSRNTWVYLQNRR